MKGKLCCIKHITIHSVRNHFTFVQLMLIWTYMNSGEKSHNGSLSQMFSSTASLTLRPFLFSHLNNISESSNVQTALRKTKKKKTQQKENSSECINLLLGWKSVCFALFGLLKVPLLSLEAQRDAEYWFSFWVGCIDSCEDDRHVQLAVSAGTRWETCRETHDGPTHHSAGKWASLLRTGFSHTPLPPN